MTVVSFMLHTEADLSFKLQHNNSFLQIMNELYNVVINKITYQSRQALLPC